MAFIYFYASYYETLEYVKWYSPAVARRGKSLAQYEDLKYNGSLIQGNAHACIGQVTRLPQNYKAVGGFHINSTVQSLPQLSDLKTLLDYSKNGVIYFSLGSNVKSKDLLESIIRSLLEMFGKLKHEVLWKFEGSLENVFIVKWAPQQSVLSHPDCVLFVTHGGLLSTTEAIHFAKPIVGIPVFADQFANVDRLVKKGCGRRVSLGYELANQLREAIEEVIRNPRYAINTKELSLMYHDRVVPPADELVHWVEHVVRMRGALHLRSPALMVPWYQKIYLDLIAQVILVIYIVKNIVKRIFSKA